MTPMHKYRNEKDPYGSSCKLSKGGRIVRENLCLPTRAIQDIARKQGVNLTMQQIASNRFLTRRALTLAGKPLPKTQEEVVALIARVHKKEPPRNSQQETFPTASPPHKTPNPVTPTAGSFKDTLLEMALSIGARLTRETIRALYQETSTKPTQTKEDLLLVQATKAGLDDLLITLDKILAQ